MVDEPGPAIGTGETQGNPAGAECEPDGTGLPAHAAYEPGGPRWRGMPVVRLALLWFTAANLRTVILALPPVLPAIHHDLGINEAEVGLLTTLPVLLLGAGAIAGSAALAHLGARRTLVVGCVAVGAASAVRGAGGELALFGGSVLLGLAISILQPVLPSVAQAWFGARVGLATAVYGNGFIVGEAVAASITLPFVDPLVRGWQASLAAWGIPCTIAGLLFLLPAGAVVAVPGRRWLPDLASGWTWRLGAFQAGGSALYFGTNAYIPTELHAVGHASLVSPCLTVLNVSQLAAAVVVGVLAQRGARTRPAMAVAGACAIGGIALVAFLPGPAAVVGCGVVGLCSAIAFVVALALPAVVADPFDVHRLSAGMFGIGYVGAFVLPLLGGLAWDGTGQPRLAFLPSLVGAALLGGALAWRPRPEPRDPIARLNGAPEQAVA